MDDNKFSMKMIVQCHECATALEFIIVNNVSRGNGDMFQISVSPCPFCEELRKESKGKKKARLIMIERELEKRAAEAM